MPDEPEEHHRPLVGGQRDEVVEPGWSAAVHGLLGEPVAMLADEPLAGPAGS